MKVVHPAEIRGFPAASQYLRFIGVPVTPQRLRTIARTIPGTCLIEKTDGGQDRYRWTPTELNETIRAITGLDADLVFLQKQREAKREREARKAARRGALEAAPVPVAPAEEPTDGAIVPPPLVLVGEIWEAPRPLAPGEGLLLGGRLAAYAMRDGTLRPIVGQVRGGGAPRGPFRVGEPGEVPAGAVGDTSSAWPDARAVVEEAWPDVVWWVYTTRTPTAGPTAPPG